MYIKTNIPGPGTPSHNSSGNAPGNSTPNSTVPNSLHSPGNSASMHAMYIALLLIFYHESTSLQFKSLRKIIVSISIINKYNIIKSCNIRSTLTPNKKKTTEVFLFFRHGIVNSREWKHRLATGAQIVALLLSSR